MMGNRIYSAMLNGCRLAGLFVVLCVVVLQPRNVWAKGSVLERFEHELDKEEVVHVEEDDDYSHEYTYSDSAWDDLWLAFFVATGYGTINSMHRVSGSGEDGVLPRQDGDPLLSFAAIDYNYHFIEENVRAHDYRVELGYGPAALQYRHTAYREESPTAELDFRRVDALLRLSFVEEFECDIGLGVLTVDGEHSRSGFSWSFPILFHPTDFLGFELRPSWAIIDGSTISEFDAAFVLGQRYVFLQAGYRWVNTGEVTLEGGYLGLSLRY